jgi:hypothetical protein
VRDRSTIAQRERFVLRSDRTYRFDARPDSLWAAIGDTGSYQHWWPWLRSSEANGLRVGDRWDCAVQPPLPYQLRASVTLTRVTAPSWVSANISGDLRGAATIDICPDGAGSMVRLVSHLASPKHAELIVLWISEHGPGRVALSNVNLSHSKRDQAGHFGSRSTSTGRTSRCRRFLTSLRSETLTIRRAVADRWSVSRNWIHSPLASCSGSQPHAADQKRATTSGSSASINTVACRSPIAGVRHGRCDLHPADATGANLVARATRPTGRPNRPLQYLT